MDEFDIYGEKLNALLLEEAKLLSVILQKQRAIRNCVNAREWPALEKGLNEISELSIIFQGLERQREQQFTQIASLMGISGGANTADIYILSQRFSSQLREAILTNFRALRQDLILSKIENESLNRYISCTTALLKGLFDDVVPQRRNKIYSRRGTIAAREPDSLIFNQSL